MSDILHDVQAVFRDVFDDDELVIGRSTSADDLDDWNSIANIGLFVAIERAFGVKLATAEMAQLTREGQTVGDLVSLLEKKLEAPG